jgi:phosphoglucosamine mutase
MAVRVPRLERRPRSTAAALAGGVGVLRVPAGSTTGPIGAARPSRDEEPVPFRAMRLARATAAVRPAWDGRFAVARDTARSGHMLAAAVSAGLMSLGIDVTRLGVAPAAALAFVAAGWRHDGGILVATSRARAGDPGLALFDGAGARLAPADERRLAARASEADALPGPADHCLGAELDGAAELDRYRADRIALARRRPNDARIVVDCANGSASDLAGAILGASGAEVRLIAASPSGINLEVGCGAGAPAALAAEVLASGADVGFAFDADADRCVVVDETGSLVDDTALLGMLALDRLSRKALEAGGVVTTDASAGALEQRLRARGGRVHRLTAGEGSLWTAMERTGAGLGGDGDGHVVLREHGPTPDAMVTALEVLALLGRTGRPVSALGTDLLTGTPSIDRLQEGNS